MAGPRCWRRHAHLLHRGQRQGRQARRRAPRRPGPPGHQRRPRPAGTSGGGRPAGGPDRRRRDLLGAGRACHLRRAGPAREARLRRRRALRRDPADPARLGRDDVRDERAEHLQRAGGRDPARHPQDRVRLLGDDLRDLLRPGRAATGVPPGRRGPPDRPGGRLRHVEGRGRGDRALLPGPHRGRHLRAADQQRHRAARVRRAVPGLPRRPGAAPPQHLRLHRHPRPRPADAALPGDRRAGLPGLQRRQRRPVGGRLDQEIRDRFYDGVEVRRELGRDETFYAIDKARDLLGFEPQHSWRDVLADPEGRQR